MSGARGRGRLRVINWNEMVKHYLFTEEDVHNLAEVREVLEPYAQEFADAFYQYLANYPEMAGHFPTKAAVEKREGTMVNWFRGVMSGAYDNHYVERLRGVGRTHVQREIPIHWVTSSMNFKRDYMAEVLRHEVEDPERLARLIRSLNKILDINLDIVTSSYHEEQLRKTFLTERFDSILIRFADRFTYGLNIVLVLALIGLSIGVTILFGQNVYELFFAPDLVKGIITALGTLLIVWVLVELMDTEIRYLKGASFRIEIFVAVALVSVIRELMILTLQHEATNQVGILMAAVLILGVVYYLIVRSGRRAAH
jgi:uncharacterized membrane protein (DUF373 family)